MDRKSLIVVIVCIALLIGWHQLVNRIYPRQAVVPSTNDVAIATSTITNLPGTNGVVSTIGSATAPAAPATLFLVNTNLEEQTIIVTNESARYTFTSHGGGLKRIELIGYPETITRKRDRPENPDLVTLNSFTSVPTLAVTGGEAVQGDGIFTLTRTDSGVRAEKSLANGLAIVKEFQLSTNFLVGASVRLENRSEQPLPLPTHGLAIGTATPINASDLDKGTVKIVWFDGDDIEKADVNYFSDKNFACLPRTPRAEYRDGESNVVWAAVQNQFFTLILMPQDKPLEVVARKVPLPAPTIEQIRIDSRVNRKPEGLEASVVYPAVTLSPGQSVERRFEIFAGPKEYQTLAGIAQRFQNGVDQIMEFGGFFGFFSKALLLGMNWLHAGLKIEYGWAIIAITVLIKLLFWPLTQASTRSMKRMQALQPQMKVIQEKYKEDPMKAQRKVMEFMKENKVSPLGGCLPMLIQMPVFIGFFFMIQSAIELRGASWFWAIDLSRPDTIFFIPGINFPVNPLPLLMGVTMLWQAQLMPPSPGMDPMQQKLLKYMPLMFLFFLYNYSSGLALYWTVNNLLSILQTKLTRTVPVTAPVATAPVKSGKAPSKAPALTSTPKKKK